MLSSAKLRAYVGGSNGGEKVSCVEGEDSSIVPLLVPILAGRILDLLPALKYQAPVLSDVDNIDG